MSSSKRRRWTTSYWRAHRARGGSAAPRAAGAVGTGPAETATAPSTAAAAASPPTDTGSPESIWRWAAGWLAVAVGLPTMFWLHFGVIDGAALGFTGFLLLLTVAVPVVSRQTGRLGPFSRAKELTPGPYDFLGVIWLLLIPFGPFVAWLLSSWYTPTVANWYTLSVTTVALCVAGPLVCVLPLLPYVRGKPAAFMAGVLLVGTAFPVACGSWALHDVIKGPAWEAVTITALRNIAVRRGASSAPGAGAYVLLEDGRRLTHAPGLSPRVGPARLLILGGYRHVLAVGR